MAWETSELAAASESDPHLADASTSDDASSPEGDAPLALPADPAALWERFHQELRAFIAKRIAGKADADDLLQAIYLRIHTTLSRPVEIVHPRGWIFQVARSVLVDYLRAARAKDNQLNQVAEGNPDEPELASVLGVDDEEAGETLVGCLQPVLDTLPEQYREALVWTELHNMSQREAATRAGISLSCMKSRVQRGRAYLKDALLACCDVQLDRRRHPIAVERRNDGQDSTEPDVKRPACSSQRGTESSCG